MKELLNDCGCCEGIGVSTPVAKDNRPGLTRVRYRIGTHSSFKDSMLARLSSQFYPSLAGLKTRDDDDFTIGLIDAFATVADVLSFYQDRIANEAWLRSSLEQLSVNEQARLIGYRPAPGVAASVDLAFTLEEPLALPQAQPFSASLQPDPQPVNIDIGTKVQSIPGQDEEAQIFETIEAVLAWPEWNLLRPLLRLDQDLLTGDLSASLKGITTQLQSGSALLILPHTQLNNPNANHWQFRKLSGVSPDPDSDRTLVKWSPGLTRNFYHANGYKILAMRETAAVFGHNAVDWRALSDEAMADYLGITEASLTTALRADWSNYSTYASGNQRLQMQIPTPVTMEMVMQAISATAGNAASNSISSAASMVPRATMSGTGALVSALNSGLKAAGELVMSVMSAVGGSADDIDTIIGEEVNKLLDSLRPISPGNFNFNDQTDLNMSMQWPDLSTGAPGNVDLTHLLFVITQAIDQLKSISYNQDLPDMKDLVPQFGLLFNPLRFARRLLQDADLSAINFGEPVEKINHAMASLDEAISASALAAGTNAFAGFITSVCQAAVDLNLVDSPEKLAALSKLCCRIARDAIKYTPGDSALNSVEHVGVMVEGIRAELNATGGGNPGLIDPGYNLETLADFGVVGGVMAIGPAVLPLLALDMTASNDIDMAVNNTANAINAAVDSVFGELSEVPNSGYSSINNAIDLNRRYPSVVPGSWAVLVKPGKTAVFKITSVVDTSRAQYMISGQVTRLYLQGTGLADFANAVRSTAVYIVSEELPPAQVDNLTPVEGIGIDLNKNITNLPKERKLILAGQLQDGSGYASETVSVAQSEAVDAITRVTLAKAMLNSYQRQTLMIFANVAAATHGETVYEVLGNGDARGKFQRFTLQQPPLTYVPAGNSSGAESSLKVYVDDILWQEVPHLYQRQPTARIYTTRMDKSGSLVVQFGDGSSGARLPTGQNNVRAEYRKGIGLGGLVRKAQLSQLMSRPLGLKEVINPGVAQGAADPDALEHTRSNAPLTALTLDRVVSVQDYADYARNFAGIAKAHAVWFWNGRNRKVLLTVAGEKGAHLEEDGATLATLIDSLEAAGDPYVEFDVRNYQPLCFRMSGSVKVVQGYIPEKVLGETEAALRRRFSFEQRHFGQSVPMSEVIEVVQAHAGVVAVDIDTLYSCDCDAAPCPSSWNARLDAQVPRLGGDGSVEAAQILILDSNNLDSWEAMP